MRDIGPLYWIVVLFLVGLFIGTPLGMHVVNALGVLLLVALGFVLLAALAVAILLHRARRGHGTFRFGSREPGSGDAARKKDGTVSIDSTGAPQGKRFSDKAGDYVDFEEVDD